MNTDYRQHICDELQAASRSVADYWLKRIEPIVQEDVRNIFPTEQYLDHIPSMIEEIASLLTSPSQDFSLLSSVISRKALELGTLRHEQKATVSQLLREYDILENVLEEFVIESSQTFQGEASIKDAILMTGALNSIVRFILQCTVDSFTENYMKTIHEQTEKLVSFNRFLGHELRTPLQSALLNTELMIESRQITDRDMKELLSVKNAIQTASSLISNIEQLIQTSDDVGVDSLAAQTIELDGLITDIREQLSGALRERGIQLTCRGDLGALNIETGRLRIVLMNLISNSIKYSDANKDDRTIEIFRDELPDLQVALSVWDNGLGIPADLLDDVQDLRVRAHRQMDSVNGVSGQGIGLYLVAEAVKDLSGSMRIESEEGSYTCVTLTLPDTTVAEPLA